MSHPPELELIYPLDAWPPKGASLLLALQWLFLMLPLSVIPASVLGFAFGLSPEAQAEYLQRILILTGLGTAVQAYWGNKLTLITGPAAVLLVGYISAGGGDIYSFSGAMILGGIVLLLLGISGLLRKLMNLFTPNVVAAILILVAVSLIPVVAEMAAGKSALYPSGRPSVLMRSVGLALLIIFMSQYLPRLIRPLAIFIGILIGLFISLFTGAVGIPETPGLAPVALPGLPSFSMSYLSPSILLPFLFCYLALAVNEIGSVQGMGQLLLVKDTDKRQDRSFIVGGLVNILSGFMGTIGSVSYSMSPGVVGVTRVASRHVLMLAALMLFVIGLSPRLAAFINLIPGEVAAAALLAILGTQLGAGVAILVRQGNLTARDFMVVGFPVILGGVTAFLPQDFYSTWPASLAGLLGNSMVTGVLAVLLLEHGLRTREPKS